MNDDAQQRIFESLERLEKGQDKMARALFGEDHMEQPGLVKDVAELKAFKNAAVRKAAFFAGFSSGLAFALERIWEWFRHKQV